MSDAPDNLILVYLRRMDAKIDTLTNDVGDLKRRMTALEIQAGQMIATEQTHYAAVTMRLDRVEDRLDRIERRLDVVPA
jgi:phage shock protein A